VDQEVTVELKNDLAIKGILKSVDQFLNIKLDDITVIEEEKYPHLVTTSIPSCLICSLLLRMSSFEVPSYGMYIFLHKP